MKKPTSIIGWVCAACFLSCFVTDQAIASDAVPNGESAQSKKSKKMKLEELVQKLEDANPWSVEKVSEVLGVKLTPDYSNQSQSITSYVANRLEYGEGLIVDEAKLRLSVTNNEMIRLILDIAKDVRCFKHEHLKKIYPAMDYVDSVPRYIGSASYLYSTYRVKRPWGDLFFKFDYEQQNCLIGVTLTPRNSSTSPSFPMTIK